MTPLAFPALNRMKACRHGTLLYNIHDIYIGRSLDLYGEFSEEEVDLFRQVLRPNMIVVEVGANIGAHTVALAQFVGPGGMVLAFEPQRIVYQILCANLALNSIPNVDCRREAVGREKGALLVPPLDYGQPNNFGGVGMQGHGHGEPVPLVTLDSLALARLDLLKVDVEGMEQEVIVGAAATITRCRPLLYVENDRPEKAEELVRTIDRLGYDMFQHRPPLYSPANFAGNPHNVFGNTVSINMICTPRGGHYVMQGYTAIRVAR